tara:strand:- start:1077 stop:1310 length:234 start_codon:yes stop_codon:yes gene_type:complete
VKILKEIKFLEEDDKFTLKRLAENISESENKTEEILKNLEKESLVELDIYQEDIAPGECWPVLMNVWLTDKGRELIK